MSIVTFFFVEDLTYGVCGAAAHAAFFGKRDLEILLDPTTRYNDLLDRVLRHRDAIISHLNWHSDVWGSISDQGVVTHITGGNFAQSSITINGWLRDFLWAQASQVIQSYGSSLSAYGLFFLGAHFVWAFSLMFLFSGRGYWQELIESIVWAHNKLKVAPATQPRALSIVQGRAVGVTHYLLGGIATTWAFFLARIIAVG
uniref:Putative photosystem I PsaA/PsaB n=1 Tax=Helianthus annuus TaxID=4232 RepID=A0A1Y3BXN1_HELAN